MEGQFQRVQIDKSTKHLFIEEHHDTFNLWDEIGTCPYVQVHLKSYDKVSFFIHPYAVKEEKQQTLYGVCTDLCVLHNKLIKINHAFPIVRDCIQTIGQSYCEIMINADI